MRTFKAWRLMSIATGILSVTTAFACPDPVLRTNREPSAVFKRYVEINQLEGRHSVSLNQRTQHGAEALIIPKEKCFLYPNLRSQYDIPCLARLIRAYEALPNKARRISTIRDGKKVELCVHVVGNGTHKTVLICIPGVMADVSEFRFLAGALADDYDFWLVDPPGCGDSEAPEPAQLAQDGYSPGAMAERELQAVQVCLQERVAPARILLMAHSLGGMVALRAFSDPELRERYGSVLKRIEGLVLLSPGTVFRSQVNPVLASRAELSGLQVEIGASVGRLKESIAVYLAGSFYASHCLSREEVDRAAHIIANQSTRNAFKAMLHQALPFDSKSRRLDFEKMKSLESWYTNVDVPCQIIWGQNDQTLPVETGYMLQQRLPNANLMVIPECKHAPNLECPANCARLIREADREIAARRLAAPESVSTSGGARNKFHAALLY